MSLRGAQRQDSTQLIPLVMDSSNVYMEPAGLTKQQNNWRKCLQPARWRCGPRT